jgi:hypothetical protein
MKTFQQPYEKYGVSESLFLITYTAGYNSAYSKTTNPYKTGTASHKIWTKGKRDAKKIY